MFDVMAVLDWTARECASRSASEDMRDRCFHLVGNIKSKGGNERDAALAVRELLDRFYPRQISLPVERQNADT